LTVTVPAGATTGPIAVTVNGLTVTSTVSLTVLATPSIPQPAAPSIPQPAAPSIPQPAVIADTPAATIYAPRLSVGKTLTAKSIAIGLGVTIPKKAKTAIKVAKSSKKFCKVKSGKIVGVKKGPCLATVTVQAPKPKKGKKPKPVKKSVTVQIS
jgi:hypothetical protein